MGVQVICQQQMNYDGTERYRGELFNLGGLRNDDKLVRVGHVRAVTGDMNIKPVRDDATGREFVDDVALRAYQLTAPRDIVVVRRRPGRPPGSRSRKPAKPKSDGIQVTGGEA